MALGRLSVVLDANIANFQSDLGRAARLAEQQSRAMQRSFEGAAKHMGGSLAGALAGTVTIGAFVTSMKKSIDTMLQMGVAAKSVGMATGEFAALAGAARRADLDTQSLATALQKASRQLVLAQGGDKTAASAFRALGIDPAQVKDSNDLLLKTADALSKYRDGAGKTALEMQLFGKSGAQLNAFLDQGSAAIKQQEQHMRDLGVAFGPDAEDKLKAYDNAQKEFSDTVTGLENKLAIALLPTLQSAAEYFGDMVKSMDSDSVSGFTAVVNTLANAGIVLANAFHTAGSAVGALLATVQVSWSTLTTVMDPSLMAERMAKEGPQRVLSGITQSLGEIHAIWSAFASDTAAQWSKAAAQMSAFGQAAKNATLRGAAVPAWMKAGLPSDNDRPELRFNPVAPRAPKAAKDPTAVTQALVDQIAKLTMSANAYERYQLAQKGAKTGELEYATALQATRDELQARADKEAELKQFLEQHQAEIRGVSQAELQFTQLSNEATEALNAHLLKQAEFDRVIAEGAKKLNGDVRTATDSMTQYAIQAARNMQDAFAEFLFDPFKGGLKGMLESFGETLRKMYANMVASKVFDALANWGTNNAKAGGFWGALAQGAASMFGKHALGAVYASSSLATYANGIYDTPQAFRFAHGAGIFGEAGPEAIMPLARGADGKLGVAASGARALSVEVNITNKGDPVQARQTGLRTAGNKVIVDMVLDAVSGDVAGGGRIAKAMQQRFGLARRGVPVGA